MALHLKEYRDPKTGCTYQYDEGDQPNGYVLVERAVAKAKEPAGFVPNKDESKPEEKGAPAPENKAAKTPAAKDQS